jgi:hypothetical protein
MQEGVPTATFTCAAIGRQKPSEKVNTPGNDDLFVRVKDYEESIEVS